MRDNKARPKYVVGQKVIIQPISEQGATRREDEINQYAGQVGEVSNYYWVNPRNSQVFFMYHVQVGEQRKEIAVYEDELEPCLS